MEGAPSLQHDDSSAGMDILPFLPSSLFPPLPPVVLQPLPTSLHFPLLLGVHLLHRLASVGETCENVAAVGECEGKEGGQKEGNCSE